MTGLMKQSLQMFNKLDFYSAVNETTALRSQNIVKKFFKIANVINKVFFGERLPFVQISRIICSQHAFKQSSFSTIKLTFSIGEKKFSFGKREQLLFSSEYNCVKVEDKIILKKFLCKRNSFKKKYFIKLIFLNSIFCIRKSTFCCSFNKY
eukprot:TRINITY_DN457_c0_g1_i11.p4 TRINITY_DN457_c0_g1~~TRINITY_DN457_c0_g1_i11.p4  ORF type:complete len:151 (+),score=2.00 TRINITY_DN457_c0_g1_i11:702-1154(+)